MPEINEDTGIVPGTVIDIMTYIFNTFGEISDQKLNEEHQKVINHTCIHSGSMANVFNVISKYTAMTDSHGTPKTNEQMIIMGRIIITHAWIFAESVGKWDNEPSDEKTRPNFKTHLTAAQINHKKAHPVDTTSQHGYTNQANTAEKFLLKIETRKQHESYFAAELDIHKEIEALKQQLAITTQREDNTPSSKTEMQLLMETVNSLKAQMNNKN